MAIVPNIGPAERRRRHRGGVLSIFLGVVVVSAAWSLNLSLGVRASSALLFFVGFVGVFQARASTCVALASRGVRDMDAGEQGIRDPEELKAVRAQARRVLLQSVLATLLVTAVAVAIG